MKIVGLSQEGAKKLPLIICWTVFLVISSAYLFVANAGFIYQSESEPNVFLYKGEIKLGDAGYITSIPENSTLYMESPGGRFLEGLSMGYIINKKNLTVRPYGAGCYSSCAFAASFADDVKGTFHFHAPYNAMDKSIDPEAIAVMRQYLIETGKFDEDEIQAISKVPHNKYHSITF